MAATNKRLRDCNLDDETAAPSLPLDLLLEILARSDVETIVRSAAASRTLRGAVLDVGFRRRLALRAADHGGYDPGLLRGISYSLVEHDTGRGGRVARALPSSDEGTNLIRFGASTGCILVSSRDGLVLLRHAFPFRSDKLSVCNSITGHATLLPPTAITSHYPPVLLNVGGGSGRSFEVLAADRWLQTQTYSSLDGEWSAVVPSASTQDPIHGHHQSSYTPLETSHPVVIGRTVHWLCYYFPFPAARHGKAEPYIVALDVDAAHATVMELPKDCMGRMTGARSLNALMLVVSGDGMLGVVVSETSAISMWTFSASRSPAAAQWSRRVILSMPRWGEYGSIETSAFGERSGTVILSMTKVGLVQLNVGTAEQQPVVVLRRDDGNRSCISQVCLHEINLDALLSSMKSYSYR